MIKYSYLFFIAGIFIASCSPNVRETKTKSLKPVGFDAITVDGELKSRALRNYDRLESDIYTPEKVFPNKHEGASEGWPGDYEGRVILALTLEAQATHREPKYLAELIRMIPEKVNSKGYLGSILKDSINEQQLSGHGWFLRGLCEYYEWKKDPNVKTYIHNIVKNLVLPTKGEHRLYPIAPAQRKKDVGAAAGTTQNTVGRWQLSSDIGCNFIFMDGVIQAYTLFPDKELKGLVDEMIQRFFEMDLVAINAQTHATLTGLRGVLRYYEFTGDRKLLAEVEKRYKLYRSLAMTENFENYNWFGRPEWTEPCAIVDAYMVATQLWMHTRAPLYLEDAHHIYYNGLAHTQHANGGFGLDNCVGPVDNTLKVIEDEAFWCCTMRGGEGLARAIQYNYFTDKGLITVPFFNSGRASFLSGTDKLVLKQESDYPYEGKVKLSVVENNSAKPVAISLFAPSWALNENVTLNGEKLVFKKEAGMVNVIATLKSGDQLEYNFEMETKLSDLLQPGVGDRVNLKKIVYGPLVLGYEGKTEISLPAHAAIEKIGEHNWKVKGSDIELTPVFHVLDPSVKKTGGYTKQILFKTN